MTEQVSVTISPPLDCNECDEVLLELHNPILLDANVGLPDPNDGNPFLRAKIIDITEIAEGLVNYVFEYDETLLTNPGTPLEPEDIKQVCCVGCTLKYLDTFAICEIIQNSDPDCLNGVQFFTITSDTGPDQVINGGDLVTLVGGNSLTVTASNPETFTFDVNLSGDAGNILIFGTDDNLFLDCATVLGCINVVNPISGDGSGGSPFGIDISADVGNTLELRGDGLYVPDTDTVLTCTQVLNCINVENPISGDGQPSTPFTVDISAIAGNAITLEPDGLAAVLTIADCTDVLACINVANPIVGDGSGGSPFTVALAGGANALSIQPGGLFAPDETITTFAQVPGGPGVAPSGARLYRYTSEDATQTDIPAGIHTLDITDVCEGVGANNMVKQFDITNAGGNNTLTVRSAPEVSHDGGANAFVEASPFVLDALGTQTGSTKGPYVFANPFTCRRAAIVVTESVKLGWRKLAGGGAFGFDGFYERRYGVGPWTLVETRLTEDYGAVRVSHVLFMQNTYLDLTNGPLAIGSSLSLSLRAGVTVHTAGPAGSEVYALGGFASVRFYSTL